MEELCELQSDREEQGFLQVNPAVIIQEHIALLLFKTLVYVD